MLSSKTACYDIGVRDVRRSLQRKRRRRCLAEHLNLRRSFVDRGAS
jgi:hypothetical protein